MTEKEKRRQRRYRIVPGEVVIEGHQHVPFGGQGDGVNPQTLGPQKGVAASTILRGLFIAADARNIVRVKVEGIGLQFGHVPDIGIHIKVGHPSSGHVKVGVAVGALRPVGR